MSENARDPCKSIPVPAADVSLASKADHEIASVMQFFQHGWLSNINESLASYPRCRGELTLEAGCYVRGYRTVIPAALQQTMLGDLHAVHVGVVRMEGMARIFFWWPGADKDIKQLAAGYRQCQELSNALKKETLIHGSTHLSPSSESISTLQSFKNSIICWS